MYFVTSVEEERADAALDGMFKFLAAQENDTIRDRTIRQVKSLVPVFGILYLGSFGLKIQILSGGQDGLEII